MKKNGLCVLFFAFTIFTTQVFGQCGKSCDVLSFVLKDEYVKHFFLLHDSNSKSILINDFNCYFKGCHIGPIGNKQIVFINGPHYNRFDTGQYLSIYLLKVQKKEIEIGIVYPKPNAGGLIHLRKKNNGCYKITKYELGNF
jgi:hypothetical protein